MNPLAHPISLCYSTAQQGWANPFGRRWKNGNLPRTYKLVIAEYGLPLQLYATEESIYVLPF
jgi:hypothetical protein